MRYKNISNNLELEIRREFSSKLKNFIALKKWIEDAIGQLVIHDPGLYSFKTRVKDISSVLTKVAGKIEDEKDRIDSQTLEPSHVKWMNAKSYGEIESLIDDWVGSRIITYLHDSLVDLHAQITSHKRLKIVRITVHDSADKPRFQNLKLKKGRDERRINHNGYVGIHYIIDPQTVDPCWNQEPRIFQKFELQVRTLLQETWGQIQHAVIYKGRMPEYLKQERSDAFAGLAGFLAECDIELARLAKEPAVRALRSTKKRKQRARRPRQSRLQFT